MMSAVVSKRAVPFYSIALAAMLFLTASPALAVSVSFFNITGNNATNAAIGEAQLSAEVTDSGSGQVLFSFFNVGTERSSITDIYFDNGPLLALQSIDDSNPGVDFVVGARPLNLPGANNLTPAFQSTLRLSTSSAPPVYQNGVNPGESVGLLFQIKPLQSFGDVLAALGSGALRIGLKVQGFANGGSESFVNTPIPEPGTMVGLCTFGLVGVAARRMRRTRAAAA
jgi:hypothetical protein